jgi:hypothetical protein
MFKIYTNEAETIINLIDVNSADHFDKLMNDNLTETELEILADCSFEGDFVDEDEDIEGIEIIDKSISEYINDLKEFCKVVIEESEM